jgi:signal transduction histidine kinase
VAVAVAFAAADTLLGLPSQAPTTRWALVVSAAVVIGFLRWLPLVVLGVECVLFVLVAMMVPVATGLLSAYVLVALAVVAYRCRWPVTTAALAVVYAMLLTTIAQSDNALLTGPGGILRAVTVATAVAMPVVLGRHLRGMRHAAGLAEQRAIDAERRRQAETHAARLQERTRLAGDLHDIVAHHVSAIAMQAGAGHYAATRTDSEQQRLEEAVKALRSIRDNAGQALVEVRGLLHVLRDPHGVAADDRPTVAPEAMITDAVRRSSNAGLDVDATVDDRLADAPLAVRVTAARAVQEALTNVLKHAGPGTHVAVTVALTDHLVCVEVLDSGPRGCPPTMPASGHGLAGMRQRVDILGGTLTAEPAPPFGWRLAMSLPLPCPVAERR